MRRTKYLISRLAAFVFLFLFCSPHYAGAELHWQSTRKEHLRVRLIALASHYPRSSFFPNEEVFVAEKELEEGESRLVKLIYGYLPYQPRLSEQGMDYSLVHEVRALRDHNCDETLSEITKKEGAENWVQTKRPKSANHSAANHVQEYTPQEKDPILDYSEDSPSLSLNRRRAPLPCYVTNADDYSKGTLRPADPNDRP
jgi:hypothetical protein